jgi:uncharacterized protein (DUF1330 family)
MAEYEKKVRDILKKNGCYFLRHGRGDHVTVDGKIKSRHTANEILKQSGIDYHF